MNNKDNTITVNNKSFTVLKLLGKGKGGYSYLVEDNDSYNFVVKQIHHEPCVNVIIKMSKKKHLKNA